MEDCCRVTTKDREERCPECGHRGRPVGPITLLALLRPAALERRSAGEHRFCPTASCEVVYFGQSEVFRRDDVLVPVFQKEPEGGRTVCYCFAVSEDEIRREVEASGRSAAAARIKALVQAERCACEVRNPQGSCCLGNVTEAAKAAEAVAASAYLEVELRRRGTASGPLTGAEKTSSRSASRCTSWGRVAQSSESSR